MSLSPWMTRQTPADTGSLSPGIPPKVDLSNHEPDDQSTLLQEFARYNKAPPSKFETSVDDYEATEALPNYLASLTSELQAHPQYFTPDCEASECITWVQEALGDQWTEYLGKMEIFERERGAWLIRQENLKHQFLEECQREVVRMWIWKQEQSWEVERKRWVDEEKDLAEMKTMEVQKIQKKFGMSDMRTPVAGGGAMQWPELEQKWRIEKQKQRLALESEAEAKAKEKAKAREEERVKAEEEERAKAEEEAAKAKERAETEDLERALDTPPTEEVYDLVEGGWGEGHFGVPVQSGGKKKKKIGRR